ncbi:S-methylmethionine-dependent homocysteine/selenocysteine methylase [Deinococcus metalli]|uniref:Homocysteine S-methyltransferase n=1 Tax=Deinococcus metalli TaxID=1141878 RepID=A0A7W8NSZ5_9DEIO|nr:homocysteine S-methyltransferase family protein [Deinococcus metalli]MBB5377662.1 S-methylmethionine-dependent homocysteine/selenocysteine methylase [Deinococcus metalli]GHF52390.1 homocysteine S-methyltransferase [Deinococcus metalli]
MTGQTSQFTRFMLTDGGLETDLLYNRGIDLPCFASVVLLRTPAGRAALEAYYRPYLDLARELGAGFILESATWRASPDWAAPLGLDLAELDRLNVAAIDVIRRLRAEYADDVPEIVLSGCIGPRGDGYVPGELMDVAEATAYHAHQARVLASAGVDMISALTMTNVNEAIGIARAAQAVGVPVVISFTVETDGRLPTGDTLMDAVLAVDAATEASVSYFMINCAHPDHFAALLGQQAPWTQRILGIRANASRCSHEELNAMTELDDGDPTELGQLYRALLETQPQITVLGGCCGTDLRHVTAVARACLSPA